jgi:hypothetical protein
MTDQELGALTQRAMQDANKCDCEKKSEQEPAFVPTQEHQEVSYLRDKARLEALLLQIPMGILLLIIANILYFKVYHEVMWMFYDIILYFLSESQ